MTTYIDNSSDRRIEEPDIEYDTTPRELGVVFKISIDAGFLGTRTIVLKFPHEVHSDTGHKSKFTQAEFAEMFLKNGGKWEEWSVGNLESFNSSIRHIIIRKIELMYDEQRKKSAKEWVAVLRRKSSQEKLRVIRDKIKKCRQDRDKYRAIARERMPDFEEIIGSGSIELVSLIGKRKTDFRKRKSESRTLASSYTLELKKLRTLLYDTKKDLVRLGRSKETADAIAHDIEMIRWADDNELPKIRNEYQEHLESITEPFAFGSTFNKVIDSIAKSVKNDYEEILESSKQPNIKPHTRWNRKYRGYDPNAPALIESGEFVESLKVEVI